MAERKLKLFVSSPGDLLPEREAVQRVVARINGDYLGVVHFEVIRWEEKSYSARAGFQSQIVEATSCDLVIAMLYQRMGTPLPIEVARRDDGSAFESGTAYEIETSLLHAQTQGVPQLYMFRKTANAALLAPDARVQCEVMERFWQRVFVDPAGRILRAFQSFADVCELQRQLDLCVRGWLLEQGYLRDAPSWNSAVLGSPFRGLAAFEEQHAAVYFGRRVALDLAWQRLLRAHEQGAGFLLMLGASGSGKSSLVKAGIVPQFRSHMNAHGVILAHVSEMRPGSDPLAALARATAKLMFSPAEALDMAGKSLDLAPQYLLVIDQFEELFDQPDALIAEFAMQCLALLQARRFFIVATMRADCYASLLEHAELSHLKDVGLSFDVRAPSDVDIEEMLRGPAAAAKLEFERAADGSDLADLILADLAGSDALAMMQLTLEELFQGRTGSTLTFARYRQLGGVQGALLSAAESAYASLDASSQAALPHLLSELVAGFSDSGEAMCRPVPLPEAISKAATAAQTPAYIEVDARQARARLIAALVQKRLLIVDGAQVRVAHEALVRAWPRAVQVLEEISAAVLLRARLAAPLSEWQRDSDALLPAGALLFNALELVDGKLATLLSPAERDFILRSKDADRRQRTRRTRRLSLIAGAMTVLAIVALVMAWNAKLSSDKAHLSFSASVTAVNALTRDLAQNLRQSRGVRAETVASVLSKAQALVASIEKTDPGNLDLEYARIGMLLGFSETYRSVARSKDANVALDEAITRLSKLKPPLDADRAGQTALATLRIEADLAQSQRAYFELDLEDAERYARAAFDAPEFTQLGVNPALRLNAKLKLAKTLFFQNKLKQVTEIEIVDALPSDISAMTGDELSDALDYYVAVASAKNEMGQTEAAKLLRGQASALLERALKQAPNSAQLLQTRMSLRRAEANILANGQEAQALAVLNQEITLGQEAINGNPNAATLRLALKSLLNARSQLYRKAGDHRAELTDLRRVVALLSELSEQDLANVFLRAEVSFAQRRLANILLTLDSAASSPYIAESERATLAALKIDRELLALAPKRPFARRYLAASLEQLGDLRKRLANYPEALHAYQESLAIRTSLLSDFPQEFAWYRLCALSYSALKDVYVRQNDAKQALAAQTQASAAFAKVMELSPSPAARFEWFDSMLFEAELMRSLGQRKNLAAQLLHLTEFSKAHPEEFKARPDLLAILVQLQTTHE